MQRDFYFIAVFVMVLVHPQSFVFAAEHQLPSSHVKTDSFDRKQVINEFTEYTLRPECDPKSGRRSIIREKSRYENNRPLKEKLETLSDTDLKKLIQLSRILPYYDQYFFDLKNNLSAESIDMAYRLWVRFELFTVPDKATEAQKLDVQLKNQELAFQANTILESLFYLGKEDIASIYDPFYKERTGQTFTESLKTLDPNTDAPKLNVELSNYKVNGCAQVNQKSWLPARHKAGLRFEIAKAGYAIKEDPIEQQKETPAPNHPLKGLPDKYAMDFLSQAMRKETAKLHELNKIQDSAAEYTHQGKKKTNAEKLPSDFYKRLSEVETRLAKYKKLLEPYVAKYVQIGNQARKAADDISTERQAKPDQPYRTTQLEELLRPSKPTYIAPLTTDDIFFGKDHDASQIDPKQFEATLKDERKTPYSQVASYAKHLEDLTLKAKQRYEAAEAAKNRNPNALQFALELLKKGGNRSCSSLEEIAKKWETWKPIDFQEINKQTRALMASRQSCIRAPETKNPAFDLSLSSDLLRPAPHQTTEAQRKALMEYLGQPKGSSCLVPAEESLVRDYIHAEVEQLSNDRLLDLTYYFGTQGLGEKYPKVASALQREIKRRKEQRSAAWNIQDKPFWERLPVTQGGEIDWKAVLSDKKAGGLFQTVLQRVVTRVPVRADEALDDPMAWWEWAASEGIEPYLRQGAFGCVEQNLLTSHLNRMLELTQDSKNAKLQDFVKQEVAEFKSNQAASAEQRKKQLDQYEELKRIAKTVASTRTAPKQYSFWHDDTAPFAMGKDPETVISMLSNKNPSRLQSEEALSRYLLLPPDLRALRERFKSILFTEKNRLTPEAMQSINSELQKIDSLSSEEIASAWMDWHSSNHDSAMETGYFQPIKPRDYQEPGFVERVRTGFFGPPPKTLEDLGKPGHLESQGQAHLNALLNKRQVQSPPTLPDNEKESWEGRQGRRLARFIEEAANADSETFQKMISLPPPIDHGKINPLSMRAIVEREISQRLTEFGLKRNIVGREIDFTKKISETMKNGDRHTQQELLALAHVLRSLEQTMLTTNVQGEEPAYTPDEIQALFPGSFSSHDKDTPTAPLERYLGLFANYLNAHEKNNRFINGTFYRRTDMEHAFDEIAAPKRERLLAAYHPSDAKKAEAARKLPKADTTSGRYKLESQMGPLPLEAQIRIMNLSPYSRLMLRAWFDPSQMTTQICNVKDDLADKGQMRGSDGEILPPPKDVQLKRRLFVEGNETHIADLTLKNRKQLQAFIGEVTHTSEMVSLKKAGLDVDLVTDAFCTIPKKPDFELIEKARTALIASLEKAAAAKEEKPAELAAYLLGALGSLGMADISEDTLNFIGGNSRFTPEYLEAYKIEKKIKEEGKKKPELKERLAQLDRIEQFLHRQGTILPPQSRLALLTEPGENGAGLTNATMEGLIHQIDSLENGVATKPEEVLRQVREFVIRPENDTVSSFLKAASPKLSRQLSKVDEKHYLENPIIEAFRTHGDIRTAERKNHKDVAKRDANICSLQNDPGLLSDAETRLVTLANHRFSEIYAEELKAFAGNQERLKGLVEEKLPLLCKTLEVDLRKEAALQHFDKLIQKHAAQMKVGFPPKSAMELDKIVEHAAADLGTNEAFKQNMGALHGLHDWGHDNDAFSNRVSELATSYMIRKRIHSDLSEIADGRTIPQCLKDAMKQEALGSISQGLMSALQDLSKGEFKGLDSDALSTLLWSLKDSSAIDRGTGGKTVNVDSLAEIRRQRQTNTQYDTVLMILPLQKELDELKLLLEKSETGIRYLKHQERKDYTSKELQKQLAEKGRLENLIRQKEVELEDVQKQASFLMEAGKQRDALMREQEGLEIETTNNTKVQTWANVFGEAHGGTWARLYVKYCLKAALPQDGMGDFLNYTSALALDFNAAGQEQGDRSLELAVFEELTKRQSLLSRGRQLAEQIQSDGQSYQEKDSYLNGYLKKHPNKALLEQWLSDAKKAGLTEANARGMMNQWLKTAEHVATQNYKTKKDLITGIENRGLGFKWNGLQWETPKLHTLSAMNSAQHDALNKQFDEFASLHPGANNPLRDIEEKLKALHIQSDLSPYFAVDKHTAVEVTHSPEDKQRGKSGYRYKLIPMESKEAEISSLLKKIYSLFDEAEQKQLEMERAYSGLYFYISTPSNGYWNIPGFTTYRNALQRKQQILFEELPKLVNQLKGYGNLLITKDPKKIFDSEKKTAYLAAADLMVRTMETEYDHLQGMAKIDEGFKDRLIEEGLWAGAELLSFGLAKFAHIAKSSVWALRALNATTKGAVAGARMHKIGQAFNFIAENGLILGSEMYYKYWYGDNYWEKQMEKGGGDFKLTMNYVIDKNQNNIPDWIENGHHQWHIEDPKASLEGMKHSMELFAFARVLGTTGLTEKLLPGHSWQHAVNFGIADASMTFAGGLSDPNRSFGANLFETAKAGARGTAFGLPFWKFSEKIGPVGRFMEKNPTWGPRIAQYAGLQTVDQAFFNLDYWTNPHMREGNPGFGGWALEAGLQFARTSPMNGYFSRSVNKERQHVKMQKKIFEAAEQVVKGEIPSLSSLWKDLEKENLAEARAQEQMFMETLMNLDATKLHELATKLQARNGKGGKLSEDIYLIARTLEIPPDRVIPALEKLKADRKFAAVRTSPEEQEGWWRMRDFVAREMAKDYDKALASKDPAAISAAKRRLAAELQRPVQAENDPTAPPVVRQQWGMGDAGLKHFDLDKLVGTLKFEGPDKEYDRKIAEAIGRKMGDFNWYKVDVKGLDASRFAEFVQDYKGQDSIYQKRLNFQRAFGEPKVLANLLATGKLSPEIAKTVYEPHRVQSAIEWLEKEVHAGRAAESTVQPLTQFRFATEDALSFQEAADKVIRKRDLDKWQPKHDQLVQTMLTQRPYSIGYLPIPWIDVSRKDHAQLVTKLAEDANIKAADLKREIKNLKEKRVSGVDTIQDVIEYAKKNGRLKPRKTSKRFKDENSSIRFSHTYFNRVQLGA